MSAKGAEAALLEEAMPIARRYGRESRVREGRACFYQGDRAEAALLLLEGRARSIRRGQGGRSIELPGSEAGDWLGLPEIALGAPHAHDALAETDCLFLAFSRYAIALASAMPAFASLLSRELAREALALQARLGDEGPEERILSFLLARRRGLAGVDNGRVAVTQDRIALAVGVTRETVNKRLASLERQGLLRTLRGQIEILDWDGLAARREGD